MQFPGPESQRAAGSATKSGPDSDANGSVTQLLSSLEGCDPAILAEVWRRFFPRMAGLARKTLGSLVGESTDAEDAAQSAFISFWQALDRGRGFELGNRDDLWKLLGVITARKARKHARTRLTQKRGGGKTRNESDIAAAPGAGAKGSGIDQLAAELSPPEFDLVCEELLLGLDEDHRAVAVLRLQSYSSEEIAEKIGCSQRSVQRMLKTIRGQWQQETSDA